MKFQRLPGPVGQGVNACYTDTYSEFTSAERSLVISNMCRDGDRSLELLILNEECLVSASHQLALITSLPFVHTARRSYRFRVVRWTFRTGGSLVLSLGSQVNHIT